MENNAKRLFLIKNFRILKNTELINHGYLLDVKLILIINKSNHKIEQKQIVLS